MKLPFALALLALAPAAVLGASAAGPTTRTITRTTTKTVTTVAEKHLAPYKIVATWPLGGEGGCDYLAFDSKFHRLYVTRGSHVMVVDPDSGKVVGDIPGTNGVHGVAFAPDVNMAFTSNGRDSSSTVFDLETLAVGSARPTTGAGPDAIGYDAQTKRVFTFNGRANSATVIDATKGTAVGAIALGGRPESCAFDGKGKGYVNLEDKNAVVQFDARSLQVLHTWPVTPGDEPAGLALDAAHGRLFVGCANKLMVVLNVATGKVVTTLPIGEGVDYCAFDTGTGLAFASCGGGAGTVTAVHEDDADHFRVAQDIPTLPRARTMALDPATHRIYLVTAEFGTAPAPTADMPHPRPPMVPGSFKVIVLAPSP